MGPGESTHPGACLICGGDVISRNSGKDGVCAKCGPVAFDVVQRNGQHIEGFSASAWREIQKNIVEVRVRRSVKLGAAIANLLIDRRLRLAEVSRRHPMTPFKILPGLPPYGPLALPFPEEGRGSFSEGLVVKFSPFNKQAWVGNFHRGLSGPDIVLEYPDQRQMIVIAGIAGGLKKRMLISNASPAPAATPSPTAAK
jgi:hypothetical protein